MNKYKTGLHTICFHTRCSRSPNTNLIPFAVLQMTKEAQNESVWLGNMCPPFWGFWSWTDWIFAFFTATSFDFSGHNGAWETPKQFVKHWLTYYHFRKLLWLTCQQTVAYSTFTSSRHKTTLAFIWSQVLGHLIKINCNIHYCFRSVLFLTNSKESCLGLQLSNCLTLFTS